MNKQLYSIIDSKLKSLRSLKTIEDSKIHESDKTDSEGESNKDLSMSDKEGEME